MEFLFSCWQVLAQQQKQNVLTGEHRCAHQTIVNIANSCIDITYLPVQFPYGNDTGGQYFLISITKVPWDSLLMCCFSTNLYSSLTKMLFLCLGEFVKLHHLEEGDLLILYRSQKGNFVSKPLWNLMSSSYFTHSNYFTPLFVLVC